MASREQKRVAAAQTGLYLVVIAAIVVFANLFSASSYQRWDVTKNEKYTLSKGSARLVGTLESELKLEAYVPGRGLAKVNVFVNDLTNLLKEYERAGGGKVVLTIIEPKTDEEKTKAKDAGLKPMNMVEANSTGADQASFASGYLGLVFKYKTESDLIPQLPPNWADGLEFLISNKIRELRIKAEKNKAKLGVIKSKDELKLSDANLTARQGQQGGVSMQGVIGQYFPFYDIEEVEIKESDPIDTKYAGLIITQPGKDYTEKELRRIDEFLMVGGKSLAVFAGAANLKANEAKMTATLNLHGLDGLLRGYGLDLKKDTLIDFNSPIRFPVMMDDGGLRMGEHQAINYVVDDPRFTDNRKRLDTSFPAFFRLEAAAFPFPSSIEILRDRQPADVKLLEVARTSPGAVALTDDSIELKFRQSWMAKTKGKKPAQAVIAAAAEGKLRSAYAGTPTPEGFKQREVAANVSKVFVVSSGLFLSNPFAFAGNGPNMGGRFQMFGGMGGDPELQALAGPYANKFLRHSILTLKNTLDWMTGDADLVATSAKILGDPNLSYSSIERPTEDANDDDAAIKRKEEEYKQKRETLQSNLRYGLTLGLPLVFVAVGIVRWRMRESGRSRRRL